MEQWYDYLNSFPEAPDVKIYLQTIQTVTTIAKEDLAEFEVEFLSSTVFHSPVNIFDCIMRNRSNDSWAQVIEKSFKLISEIVQKFEDYVQGYIQDIVELCQQAYAPTTRRHALNCLATVVQQSQSPLTTIARLIAELQTSDTCRAPLALLVGAICEHHPEDVSDSIEVIWRSFLKLLEGRANSETIPASILQGIYGVFKHFGLDLPTNEVNEFYGTMVQLFYTNSKCENVCLNILTHYAELFPERLHGDGKTRVFLWKKLPRSAAAIQSVYKSFKSFNDYQNIIQKEVTQHVKSNYYLEKITALRVINDINVTKMYTDIHSIIYEIKSDNTSPEILESIQICVESNLPDCDRLLKVCVDKYEHIPQNKRCVVFVHTMLKASKEVRDTVIKYLIFVTCQPNLTDEEQSKYFLIWSDIFNVNSGKDAIVLEKSKIVYEELMLYVLEVLSVNEFDEDIPPHILPLIDLTAYVITLYDKENAWYAHALKTRCSHDAVKTLANACVSGSLVDLNQILDIRRCADEASLCECCLAVITAPPEASLSDETVLEALQILFSTNKISEESLLLSLKKMEKLLLKNYKELNKKLVIDIIHKISKIENRKDLTSKEGRILRQDVALFLAKFYNSTQLYNPLSNNDNLLLSTAEDLTLSVLNSVDGCLYKVDLKSFLHTALIEEEPEVLKSILALVCTGTSESHMRVTALISIAQCACHVRGHTVQAPLSRVQCDAINHVIQYLSEQKSPGLRRMLSDGIRDMVTGAGVESEPCLQVIAEHVKIMLMNEKVETIRAGLDLARTLLSLLIAKPNHTTMQQILPQLILLTADTCQNESPAILEEATNTLIEKLALFNGSTIEDTNKCAMSNLLVKDLTADSRNVKIFKKMANQLVQMIRSVNEGCEMEGRNVFEWLKGGRFENRMYIMAIVKEVFEISSDECKVLMDEALLEQLFTYELRDKDYFAFESILKFFSQYCGCLLELRYQNTILRLREIIHLMNPEIILKINKTFKHFMFVLKNELHKVPQNLLAIIEEFTHNLNLEHVTRQLKDGDISADTELSVSAVKVVIESLDDDSLTSFVIMKNTIKEWSGIVIRLYGSGRLHEDLKFKMAFMTDVLKLSLSFMTDGEIKQLILQAGFAGLPNDKIGLDFCGHFVSSFYRFLLKKPFILLDDDMKACSSLLNEVVKQHIKLNFAVEDGGLVLDLVDNVWPIYASNSTFKQKYDLLLLLNSFPKRLHPESNPVRWMEETICDGGEFGDLLLSVLPKGKSYSDCYTCITRYMPLRLSEMDTKWRTTFSAMLECLSNTGDLALLDIMAKFAAGDSTAGWWDDQFAICALSLSKRQDDSLLDSLYALCLDIPSLCVVERLLLPVLRYSSTTSSDDFFTRHLPQLLASISKTVPSTAGERHRLNLVENTRAVMIVTVAFEKPSNKIDWQTGREVCKRCVTLRDRLHKMADQTTHEEQRRVHAACYTAVSFALVRWRRFDASVGKFVGSETAFKGLVGEVEAPIVTFHSSRTIRQSCVSDDVTSAHSTSLTLTHTHARTPVLLTYFTDHPANYDLTEERPKQTEDIHEITLPDNPLNKHECAAAMIAVIRQLSKLPNTDWLDAIVCALTGDMRCQDKWLVCQIICNLKEILSPHASKLSPALLDVVAKADGQILNAVHLQILETLSEWGNKDEAIVSNLNPVISNLLNTCLVNLERNKIFSTLDSALEKFLKSYGTQLSISEDIAEKLASNTNKNCTKIITRLLQHDIVIPNLMTSLLQSITTNRLSNLDSKHFALLKPNEGELIKFRSMLESIRRTNVEDYVKKMYYAQVQCDRTCNNHHFRMIFELVPKIVGDIKKKCLNIISSYISKNTNNYIQDMFETIEICELMLTDYVIDALQVVRNGHRQMSHAVKNRALSVIGDLCQNVSVKVRAAAFDAVNVMLRDAISQETQEHASKRPKLSLSKVTQLSSSTEVSRIVNCVCVGTTDKDSGIASMCRTTLTLVLSDNLNIRFAECLHLVLYLPSKQRIQKQTDICACVAAILEMLFHGVRQTDVWARQKIELPKCQRQDGESLLMTMSRTYQGTFARTRGINKHTIRNLKDVSTEETSISMEVVMSSFLDFAKNNIQAALNLLSSVAISFKPTSSEFDSLWEPMLAEAFAQVNEMTYLLLYVCRAGYVSESLHPQVSRLRELTTSTEGYSLVNLLYEELNIKYQNHSQFVLGENTSMEVDVVKEENYDEEFSIQKLTSAFKMLSNWDNLTLQEQNSLRTSDLPIMWTDKDTFANNIQNYTDSKDWFSTLSMACLDQKHRNHMNLLNDINRWPRRPFVLSALSEAIEWQNTRQFELEHSQYKEFEIPRDECLIEWAARLMLRSIYLQRQGSDEIALSRSHELRWCQRASEMAIPGIVNQCIERNSNDDWDRNEVLPWLHQKILSETCVGKDRMEVARKCLEKLDTTLPVYCDDTSADVLLDLNRLKMKLLDLCGELTQKNLQDVTEKSNLLLNDCNTLLYSSQYKNSIKKFYEQAMVYYGRNETNAPTHKFQNITQIITIFNQMKKYNIMKLTHIDYFVSTLEQLTDGINEDLVKIVLNELQTLLPHLDDFSLQQIRRYTNLFSSSLNSYPALKHKLQEKSSMSRPSLCLQLVCEAKFSLRQFIEQLNKALEDGDQFKYLETFDRMKRRIFENNDAGIDYQLLLNKQTKQQLFAVRDVFETDKPKIRSTLQSIVTSLGKLSSQSTLRLSQLCPYLRNDRVSDDLELREMLGCKEIVRFDEQVDVYTDSIRQPCVLKVLLTDGTTHYFIHKSGEELRRDAAAQRVANVVRREGFSAGTYRVRVLDHDSALIERLEHHQRLGSFIPGTNEVLANMAFDPRPANNLLILSPTISLINHHIRLSEKIPADALRSAIEKSSSCVEDFLMKKGNFQETLAAMTIITFILGLGDRHLNNILYGSNDGSVVSVDWGAVLWTADYELTVARLTRCLVAVVDSKVLESQLQKMLSYLRETPNRDLIYATIKTSFCWLDPQLQDKLKYIKGILNGRYLPYHITNDVIEGSKMANKEKYVELIQKVFENYPKKDFYTVEDQISCLLRQCTSFEILGAVRKEWEPWV